MQATALLDIVLLQTLTGDARQLANRIFLTVSYLTAGVVCLWAGTHSPEVKMRRAWRWWAAGWFSL